MREIYSNINLAQETRKTSNKQSTLTFKQLEKSEQQQQKKKKNKVRRKEIIKIRAEISENEMKEAIGKNQ